MMRTVQITLEEDLVEAVDLAARRLNHLAPPLPVKPYGPHWLDSRRKCWNDNTGKVILKHPVSPGEFSDFEDE
jgi:hypothetical protein